MSNNFHCRRTSRRRYCSYEWYYNNYYSEIITREFEVKAVQSVDTVGEVACDGPVMSFCKHVDEISDSIKSGHYLPSLITIVEGDLCHKIIVIEDNA